MNVAARANVQPGSAPAPVRVAIVDDSAVARGLMSHWLAEEPDLKLVASLRDGREAVDWIARNAADVVILDVEMPTLDGLAALPLLLAQRPDLVVIMSSTLTRRNAEISLKALSLGAADCVAKPESRSGGMAVAGFRRELIDKVRMIGGRRHRLARWRPHTLCASGQRLPVAARETAKAEPIALRPVSAKLPRVLAIGASTGGPTALAALLPALASVLERAPILVVQHMPPTFTTIFAEHLARATGRPAHEAVDGEAVANGGIYVAPGGRHMRVTCEAGRPTIRLDDGPPVNFCKPAVDPLFESAREVWAARIVALVLTGMGSDGTRGARAIADAGGTVIAQDESTSAVWGMPGSAATAGVCSAILPLNQIAAEVSRLFVGARA